MFLIKLMPPQQFFNYQLSVLLLADYNYSPPSSLTILDFDFTDIDLKERF